VFKHGRRLRGPDLVTTAEFNEKLGWRKWLRTYLPDGLAFINENLSWADRTFYNNETHWVRIPRDRETMHFLVVGDTAHGKSATIRQALSQIWERGETAIMYDPALEYLTQFYSPERGDVVLNPLDERCPFWTPGDEVPHPAETLTLAASLFQEEGKDNNFFVKWSREIFAHLINLKPTPEELTYWMCHAEEIDKRVRGTEMEAERQTFQSTRPAWGRDPSHGSYYWRHHRFNPRAPRGARRHRARLSLYPSIVYLLIYANVIGSKQHELHIILR